MNVLQLAEQFRKALQMYAQTLSDESAMEIASVYPKWEDGIKYLVGAFVIYGENSVGDPQLYKCIQEHTSQIDWTPDIAQSLWSAIGLASDNIPIWSRPTGAHDAYNIGDKVHYPGKSDDIFESVINGNVYSPEEYPSGWQTVE